jgi:hypothetical protein
VYAAAFDAAYLCAVAATDSYYALNYATAFATSFATDYEAASRAEIFVKGALWTARRNTMGYTPCWQHGARHEEAAICAIEAELESWHPEEAFGGYVVARTDRRQTRLP